MGIAKGGRGANPHFRSPLKNYFWLRQRKFTFSPTRKKSFRRPCILTYCYQQAHVCDSCGNVGLFSLWCVQE